WSCGNSSWRHAQRAVEPDALPVEHRVLDAVDDVRGVFVGASEPARMRDAGGQRGATVVAHRRQQRRVEEAGRDRHDAHSARSRAAGRVSPATPALEAAYATWPTCPSNAAMDAVMIQTPPGSGSLGSIAF